MVVVLKNAVEATPRAGEENNGKNKRPSSGDNSHPPKDLFPVAPTTEKKQKLDGEMNVLAFRCLACDKEACPFESGLTVLDDSNGQDNEHDPCEPALKKDWPAIKNKEPLLFDDLVNPVRTVVVRIMHSNGFWSNNKFIGSNHLDCKLRTWMSRKLDPKVVSKYWLPLRHSIKEALRYKRQQSVEAIRRVYFGEFARYYLSLFLLLAAA